MRDGIQLARRGIPSVAMVTEDFWEQGNFVARSVGMPDLPKVRLPHPVAGTGESNIAAIADGVANEVLERISNK